MTPKRLALLILVLSLGTVGALAFVLMSPPAETGPSRIDVAPGIVGVRTGHAMAYLIDAGNETVLVDAGSDASGAAILAELARQARDTTSVRHILVTHGHSDHVAAIPLFKGATTHVAELDHLILRGDRLPQAWFVRLMGHLRPRQTLPPHVEPTLPGAVLKFGERRFEVISTPGHTPGSSMYLLGDLLFSGDSLQRRGDELAPAPAHFSDDTQMAERSLERLQEAPFVGVADGHWGYTADGRTRFEQWLKAHPRPAAR